MSPKAPGWTTLMRRWRHSTRHRNQEAASPLFEQIYDELVKVAAQADFTSAVDPRELVNQLFMKWQGGAALRDWQSRTEFFNLARRALRNIVIDRYRDERRLKTLLPFEEAALLDPQSLSLVDTDEIITQIGKKTPMFGRVLVFKAYSYYTDEQIAEALGVSEATAKRYFNAAKAEFHERLRNNPPLI